MRDRLRFSHLLPLIDLVLLVLLVFVPITLTARHLYKASRGSDQVHVRDGKIDALVSRDQIVPWAIRVETAPRAPLIKAINLPGTMLEVLISLPTSWPSTWHPQALLPETWDTLVYPFFCLPFWWLVGCGLDVLVNKESLHPSLLVIGTLLSATCLTLAFGSRFRMLETEPVGAAWFIRGFTGWTIGFAILPIAWIMQSIRQRRSRSSATSL